MAARKEVELEKHLIETLKKWSSTAGNEEEELNKIDKELEGYAVELEEIDEKLELRASHSSSALSETSDSTCMGGGDPPPTDSTVDLQWKKRHGHAVIKEAETRQSKQLQKIEKHHKTTIKGVFKLMEDIKAELEKGNEMHVEDMWIELYGRGTPLHQKWEYFAAALLPGCELFEDKAAYRYAEHCGGPNDKGTDVLLYRSQKEKELGKPAVVVQVKGGCYFESGKGNNIVLSLVGSCVYHNVRRGIIFSSESDEQLKPPTKTLIREFKSREYTVTVLCLFYKDIKDLVKKLAPDEQAEVLKRLCELLNVECPSCET